MKERRYGTSSRHAADRFDRILVICTRQMGDVLLTTPLIAAAKARWPTASIDVLGFGGTLGMLRGNPDMAELIEVPAGSGWLASRALVRRLWRRYDLALIAQYSDRAHLYGFVAAKRRAGQIPEGWQAWWKRALLDHAVVLNDSQSHSVVEKLRLLAPWVEAGAVRLVPTPATALPVDVVGALRARYAVLQVPAAVAYKQWPTAHWAVLVDALVERGLQVVMTGAASAADRAAVDAVVVSQRRSSTICPTHPIDSSAASQGTNSRVGAAAPSGTRTIDGIAGGGRMDTSPDVLDVAGKLDLNQVSALLQGAVLYVGGDTSITHLATACGTPVVALYGPIDPRLFGPWPASETQAVPYAPHALVQRVAHVVLLQGDPPCVPCNRAGCDGRNDSASVCLQTIGASRVIAEVARLLDVGRHDNAPMHSNVTATAPVVVREDHGKALGT